MMIKRAAMTMLAIGDADRAEFRDVVPSLRAHATVASVHSLMDVAQVNDPPNVCLLLQAVPGEYSARDLESLLSRWPLTRFVTVAGALCEGETRTGRPWPGQLRIYWHEFPGWWSLQVARLAAGQCPEWGWPRTSREDDLLRHAPPFELPRIDGLIGVAASRWNDAARLLLDIVRDAGLNGCRLSVDDRTQVAGLRAVLWDDDDPVGAWRVDFDRLRDCWPGTPIVALLNYPRCEDRTLVENAEGAYPGGAIVAKPYDIDTLLSTLVLVTNRARSVRKT